MLILTRRVGETLMIGDHITVTVAAVLGDDVRFAVTSPKGTDVRCDAARVGHHTRVGESLVIGADIAIEVLGVKGRQVRLGTTAPKHVAVHREEVYRRNQARMPVTECGTHVS